MFSRMYAPVLRCSSWEGECSIQQGRQAPAAWGCAMLGSWIILRIQLGESSVSSLPWLCNLWHVTWCLIPTATPSLLPCGSVGLCLPPRRLDFLTRSNPLTQPAETKSSVKCPSLIWPVCWNPNAGWILGGGQCALPRSAPAEVSCAHTFHLPARWEVPTLQSRTWERLLALPPFLEIKFCILQWRGRNYKPATLASNDTRTFWRSEVYQQSPCSWSRLSLAASFRGAGAVVAPCPGQASSAWVGGNGQMWQGAVQGRCRSSAYLSGGGGEELRGKGENWH